MTGNTIPPAPGDGHLQIPPDFVVNL